MKQQLLVGASQVITCRGPGRARLGSAMQDPGVIDGDPAVGISSDGLIDFVGQRADYDGGAEEFEVDGVLFPGFVDSHTHGVFGGARLDDHERRALGVGYKEIAAQGGGILSSVRDVRGADEEELLGMTVRRLQALRSQGTTTCEVKSGYGLELESELKQLRVIRDAARHDLVPDLVPTFLGAHEVPEEFRPRSLDFIRHVANDMIPVVAQERLARFCDVFCEPGVFTPDESRVVLKAAREAGLGLKLHADELDESGGASLAAELGATSADHLAAISDEGVRALARATGTVAVLLPGTQLFLGRTSRAPARELIEAGAAVALATDFNPGSSPGMSLPQVGMLGVSQLGMRHSEALLAVTVNAAAALGLASNRGQISTGFRADLALASVRDWRELFYWHGINLISSTWVGGSACHPPGGPVNYVA